MLFLLGAALAFSVLEIVTGLMPTFALTAVALIPAGLAMLTVTTGANSHVQLGVAPQMLGAPIIGWLAETFGPRWGLVGGGLICVMCVLALGALMARRRGMNAGDVVEMVTARSLAA